MYCKWILLYKTSTWNLFYMKSLHGEVISSYYKKEENNNEGRETKKEKFAADATERLQPDASAR